MKKCKRLKLAATILIVLSFVSCIGPVLIASVKIVPAMQSAGHKLAFCGITAFFAAVIILIYLRNFILKYIHVLPYTLISLIAEGTLLFLMRALNPVIDDAIAILTIGFVSGIVAFAFEMASIICKHFAKEIEKDCAGRDR
jgi:hypothetical protein